MALESASFIHQLVPTNPVGATDPRSQGDDHLRIIKTAIQGSFPNIAGAMTATHVQLNYSADLTGVTGTGNMVRHNGPTFQGQLNSNGSEASPSIVAAADTNTGMLWVSADVLGFSAGGQRLFVINNAVSDEYLWSQARHLFPDGTSTLPSNSYANDEDTGTYLGSTGDWRVSTAGVARLSITSARAVFAVGQMQLPAGSEAAPGVVSDIDLNTGIWWSGPNVIRLTCDGTDRLILDTSGVYARNPFYVPDGSAATPGFAFESDGDLGFNRTGANSMGISAGGTNRVIINSTGLGVVSGQLFIPDGSVGDPGAAFLNDDDSGVYLVGANEVGIAAGGQQIASFGTGGITLSKQVEFLANVASAAVAGAASALPSVPVGYMAVTINGTQRRIPFYAD